MYFEIGLHPFSGFSMDVLNIFFGLQNDPLTKRNNFEPSKKKYYQESYITKFANQSFILEFQKNKKAFIVTQSYFMAPDFLV